MNTNSLLSIIILNWNTGEQLRDCLTSLHLANNLNWEVVVVDNASQDGSVTMVQTQFPNVKLIVNTKNMGFSRPNNQGLLISTGTYLLLLNSDTLVEPQVLEQLIAFMNENPKIGAISPRLVRPDGTPQAFAFGNDPTLGYLLWRAFNRAVFQRHVHNWNINSAIDVDWVSGACLLVRRSVYEQIGGLDEDIFIYFEDNDWCLRMRQQGWRICYYPLVSITHIGGKSMSRNPNTQSVYFSSLRHFYRKHYSRLAQIALSFLLPIYQRFI